MKNLLLAAALVSALVGIGQAHAQGLCDKGLCDLAPTYAPQPAPNYGARLEADRADEALEAAGEAQRRDLQERMDLNALGFGVHR
jgi:hypothetical protein